MGRKAREGKVLRLSSQRKSKKKMGREMWLKRKLLLEEHAKKLDQPTTSINQFYELSTSNHQLQSTSSIHQFTNTDTAFEVCGRRIVEIKSFFESITNFVHVGLYNCSTNNLEIKNEQRIGLISDFLVECRMCKATKKISTDRNEDGYMDVNKSAVLGTISSGGGYSNLEETLSFCNVPCMTYEKFISVENQIAPDIYSALDKLIEAGGKEEARLAIEDGNVDTDGIPKITVIADGAWSKRSYKSNYNAPSGVAVIIGQRTKKVLYVGVKNKYCYICTRAENKNKKAEPHNCFKNWNKSSTSIESEIILEGFKTSVAVHGLKYAYLVGDGDSSVTKKIAEARPYKNLIVHKIECRNHLLRNFCNHLKDLTTKRISSTRQLISAEQRNVLKNNIRRFRTGIVASISYHCKENSRHQDKISNLRRDIANSVYHIFGEHGKCEEYFCKGKYITLNII